jgi:predicted unusual protein kinase regulating ubiquinone biosynthesis (AarF/ABC1/UbiB family)
MRRLGLIAIVGAAAAAAVRMARGRRPSITGPIVAGTRAQRNLEVARIGSKAGGTYAVHRARRAFANAERRDDLDAKFQLKTAEQVAEVLGGMKGALMKLGQMASYLDQGLPEPVRDALAQLQADAPAMDPDLATATVEGQLGHPVSELFDTWDPVPMAAASIGQVHRAVTTDGRAVAVKVQYPGVDDAIKADLGNAGLLFQGVSMLFPGLEPGPIVAELRERLIEELDYRQEAANQLMFADYFRGHPFIHVPDVVADYSSGTVLTTELVNGDRFDVLQTWAQEEKDVAAEAIYRFVFRSLYRLHAFNGDPHPGNYLFHGGGRVSFLDFGLVKRFNEDEVELLKRMVQAMVIDHDIDEFRRAIADAGFLRTSTQFSNEAIADYFGHFYEWVMADGEQTITPEWSAESMRRFFDPTGDHGDIMKASNVPASFVIIQRINLGLGAVIGSLHATRNWRALAEEAWPWIDAPPSTPLGEAEAEWAARRAAAGAT